MLVPPAHTDSRKTRRSEQDSHRFHQWKKYIASSCEHIPTLFSTDHRVINLASDDQYIDFNSHTVQTDRKEQELQKYVYGFPVRLIYATARI